MEFLFSLGELAKSMGELSEAQRRLKDAKAETRRIYAKAERDQKEIAKQAAELEISHQNKMAELADQRLRRQPILDAMDRNTQALKALKALKRGSIMENWDEYERLLAEGLRLAGLLTKSKA